MAIDLPRFLLQLVVIVGGAGIVRWLMLRLGQPPVLGEIALGFALGPTLLGWMAPQAHAALFPTAHQPLLESFGWIGLVLFMYIAGSEMRWAWQDRHAIIFASSGGLAAPLILGVALAVLAPNWFFDGPTTPRRALLVAIILSVSALPVLARLLQEFHLLDHPLGTITMGAGTIDDILAWSLLAVIAGQDEVGLTGNFATNILIVLALLAAALVLDRVLHPGLRRRSATEATLFVWLLLAILGSALVTHAAGLHAVIGPFAVGALMSRHPKLRDYAHTRLGALTFALFLPTFFVLAGSEANLLLLGSSQGLLAILVVLLVASLGKVFGVYIGARSANVTKEAALVAGLLLNARGAVGLVVAKVGLDAGLLAPRGFALLVLVVVLTTFFAPLALQAYAARLERQAAGRAPARPTGPAR